MTSSVTSYLRQLRSGDTEEAAQRIYSRYFGQLRSVVRRHLSSVARREFDSEDLVQSAFRSLFSRLRQYEKVDDRSGLWHLLMLIARNKATNTLRKRIRLKRAAHELVEPGETSPQFEPHDAALSPDQQIEALDELHHVLESLPRDLRQIAIWKLEGRTNAEIAELTSASRRTVERKLELIRHTLAERLTRDVDDVCDRFEKRLRSGNPLSIHGLIQGFEGLAREKLLQELLGIELEYRLRRGDRPTLDQYLVEFPRYRDTVRSAFHDLMTRSTPAHATDESETKVPQHFGPYRTEQLLGQGAFGSVYRAFDRRLQRWVALKVFTPDKFSSQQSFERLEREARACLALVHPNIVRMLDVGRTDSGTCYVAFDYIAGMSLADFAQQKPSDFDQAAATIATLASAIHHAHSQGVVHGDLNPNNVLVNPDGDPYIIDFGLAVPLQKARLERHELAGTPPYMSPEQVRGEPLDGRSDIWALGVMFYELLVGHRPFPGTTTPSLFDEIIHREPTPPRQINDNIPIELEAICLRCLSKGPTDRYPTAADLANDLRRLAGPRPGKTRVSELSEATKRTMLAVLREKAQTVRRRTMVLFPEVCRVNNPCELRIQIAVEHLIDPTLLQLLEVPFLRDYSEMQLTICITAPGFTISNRTAGLIVPIAKDSEVVAFELVPTELGDHVIETEMFHRAQRIGYLTTESEVIADEQ